MITKKTFAYTLLISMLISCNNGSKETTLAGKWSYEKLESYSGKELKMDDPAFKEIHELNKGMQLIFNESQTYTITNKNNIVTGTGTFDLTDDKKSIDIKNSDGTTTIFEIIELKKGILKISFAPSSEEYLVFKRI